MVLYFIFVLEILDFTSLVICVFLIQKYVEYFPENYHVGNDWAQTRNIFYVVCLISVDIYLIYEFKPNYKVVFFSFYNVVIFNVIKVEFCVLFSFVVEIVYFELVKIQNELITRCQIQGIRELLISCNIWLKIVILCIVFFYWGFREGSDANLFWDMLGVETYGGVHSNRHLIMFDV